MSELQGKVVALTGAASGIGRALALELTKHGARLSLADVDEAGLDETASQCRAAGASALMTTRVDVADRAQVEAWVAATVQELSGLDAIINNAGVALGETWADVSYADLEWIFGINFWGVVHGTKAALPHLLAQNSGWIVNLSSIFGMVAFPTQGAYNATKFAVRGLNESLHLELEGTGVTVCSVHPGGIKTNIARNARVHKTLDMREDLAAAAQTATDFDKVAKTTPARAAEVIVEGMLRRERRILIGADAKAIDLIVRTFPKRHMELFTKVRGALAKAIRK